MESTDPLVIRTDDWSNAHFEVSERLADLLHQLRDSGYNPSHHVSYDKSEHHLLVDRFVVDAHPGIANEYKRYLSACAKRDAAVERILTMPKLDLGF